MKAKGPPLCPDIYANEEEIPDGWSLITMGNDNNLHATSFNGNFGRFHPGDCASGLKRLNHVKEKN